MGTFKNFQFCTLFCDRDVERRMKNVEKTGIKMNLI